MWRIPDLSGLQFSVEGCDWISSQDLPLVYSCFVSFLISVACFLGPLRDFSMSSLLTTGHCLVSLSLYSPLYLPSVWSGRGIWDADSGRLGSHDGALQCITPLSDALKIKYQLHYAILPSWLPVFHHCWQHALSHQTNLSILPEFTSLIAAAGLLLLLFIYNFF